MDVIRGVLFKHGMPTLLVCALVSLVVALIELLLLLCAACFADHIRKAAKHRSLLFSPNQVIFIYNLISNIQYFIALVTLFVSKIYIANLIEIWNTK